MSKIADFFEKEQQISKHSGNAYKMVDMTILDLYRFTNWIEEELYNEENKYEYDEDYKQSEMVEVIRYNQKQALILLHERLMKDLWESFLDRELYQSFLFSFNKFVNHFCIVSFY